MNTNGTAMAVSAVACAAQRARRGERVGERAGDRRDSTTVSMHDPRRREIAVALVAGRAAPSTSAIVLTSPPTTGFASLASVQIAEIAIVPAPMKRTCVRQIRSVCVGELDAVRRRLQVREDGHGDQPRRSAARRASPCRPTSRPDGRRRRARATTRCCSRSSRPASPAPTRRARRSRATSAASRRVAATIASPAEATEPSTTAIRPSRACPAIGLRLAARLGSDLEHFGRRDALGIGQIRVSSRARAAAES